MTETDLELVHAGPTDFWSDFDPLFAQFQRRFEALVAGPTGGPRPPVPFPRPRLARTDVEDTGRGYKITAEVPGIAKEQIDIRIEGSLVELRGEQESSDVKNDGKKLVHQERTHWGFYRALELPEAVKGEKAKATLTNGLLTLELPKQSPTPAPKEVHIKVA